MQWTDNAILLSARRHGENSAVLRLLTRSHGVYAGVLRAATSKNNRGIAQAGNVVNITWNARLSEQLGTVRAELLVPNAALCMQDSDKLTALLSACTIIESALPERHPYERLYRQMLHFMDALEHDENWPQEYVQLELAILAETGFGLDLSECAASGTREELVYVSPKSGRAVCRAAGAPYHEKLLALPEFLLPDRQKTEGNPKEILAGMQLTGYFLDAWLLSPHRRILPAVRNRLIEMIGKNETAYAAETASA